MEKLKLDSSERTSSRQIDLEKSNLYFMIHNSLHISSH